MKFTFRRGYFLLTVLLLLIEVVIGLYVHDRIIRPYVGDLLVVMLVYCFLKSFIASPTPVLAAVALAIAYLVEASQYVGLVRQLGLQDSRAARLILGSSFSWLDMLTYTLGILLVIGLEKRRGNLR
ncbi:DUF2809 domain-containing protein [Hymenobacter sp. BT683]|uniref:DUF2809 domain-containing protein n=1 Tax=Hymenobacter jeongseonensis TaxID=2791027 RepID=A0ABS0IFT5_9BACT|nr:DUF2809 domain-containing protein [Hymenobacter jeongseonensis]MBF9237223.1 DUF2809 domain-containing protein [Hymenobacter jeongseonensis]